MKKIVIISHYHPRFVIGGAQNVAFSLFKELQKSGYDVTFIAGKDNQCELDFPEPVTYIDSGKKEIIIRTKCHHFGITGIGHSVSWKYLETLLDDIKPDLIHVQHYYNWGLEIIERIKQWRRDVPLVITFHEFVAICNNIGLMIKRKKNELCWNSSPVDCHVCFPNIVPEDFEHHSNLTKEILNKGDVYISPSKFLMERYINWGLDKSKFAFIPNGLDFKSYDIKPKSVEHSNKKNRFGYFGQIAIHKGLDILLKAFEIISDIQTGIQDITLSIHAANLPARPHEYDDENLRRILPKWYQKQITNMMKNCKHVASYIGPYNRLNIGERMNSVDWVVVPSICWENQPLTIQEAFYYGKPVITGNIGGMAESVSDGIDGLQFEVGNPQDLAEKIVMASKSDSLWQTLHKGIRIPYSIQEMTHKHLKIYKAILQ